MVAQLVKKNDKYICSECRMTQYQITSYCKFCNLPFSNYEEIIIKELLEVDNNEEIL